MLELHCFKKLISYFCSIYLDKSKKFGTTNVEDEPEIILQMIFVNDGPKCLIHGSSLAI